MILHQATVAELAPGDVARGVNHNRIVTGPPVRVVKVAPVDDVVVRVSYWIIGANEWGWRNLPGDRVVTVQRAAA